MIETSADTLEFPALVRLLGRYVYSPLAQAELEQVRPLNDRARIEEMLADAREALEYQRSASGPQNASRGAAIRLRFGGLPDVSDAVAKLRIEGSTLEGQEIYHLIALLDQAEEMRAVLSTVGGTFPRLAARAQRMGIFGSTLSEIGGKLTPEGMLLDSASPALNRIRREIERQKREIEESLQRFLKNHSEEGTLQDDYVTIRNDRFVVPIVAGHKGRVDGVVHSTSGTGRTLFLEPLETIGLNNNLVRLRDEESREVARILREMTDSLRPHAPVIGETLAVVGELELLFAKAQFGLDFDCCIPQLDADRALDLNQARHPLLMDILRRERKPVVPFTLRLDPSQSMLLISGPNTGGKTVTLKTVGLIALMTHAGLPVPAKSAVVPLCDQILADIGDQQSLAESLSSFSAHMAHVKQIEAAATHDSLVLLDELGRATDPEEGGALGVALLEQFRMIGATTLASTHLLPMKTYGATTRGVVNASMGFNEETLQPTYELRVGAPGKSAALDIAARLGIPSPILERARANMTQGERDLSRLLADLETQTRQLNDQQSQLERERAAVEKRAVQLEKDYQRREADRVRQFERRTDDLVRRFEQEGRKTIESINTRTDQRKAAEKALEQLLRTKREFREEVQEEIRQVVPTAAPPPVVELAIGTKVKVRDIRETATVSRLIDDKRIEVQAGFLKLQIQRGDIVEVVGQNGQQPVKEEPKSFRLDSGPKWDVSYREVNVIGERSEEAVEKVDKFLDDASLAGVDRVRVVHGFGMGILRKAVNSLLAKNPHVARFYPAPPSEGGNGATVVELK